MPKEVVLIKLVVIEDEIEFIIHSRSDNINVSSDKRNSMVVSSSGIIFYIQMFSPGIGSLIQGRHLSLQQHRCKMVKKNGGNLSPKHQEYTQNGKNCGNTSPKCMHGLDVNLNETGKMKLRHMHLMITQNDR